MKTRAYCGRCTQAFLRNSGKSWQKLCWHCWHCWRETKGSSEKYRAPSQPDSLRVDFKKYLPLLIRLCHPDRHGNSESANKVTQWLLKERGNR